MLLLFPSTLTVTVMDRGNLAQFVMGGRFSRLVNSQVMETGKLNLMMLERTVYTSMPVGDFQCVEDERY